MLPSRLFGAFRSLPCDYGAEGVGISKPGTHIGFRMCQNSLSCEGEIPSAAKKAEFGRVFLDKRGRIGYNI